MKLCAIRELYEELGQLVLVASGQLRAYSLDGQNAISPLLRSIPPDAVRNDAHKFSELLAQLPDSHSAPLDQLVEWWASRSLS